MLLEPIKILVVDDDPTLTKLLHTKLVEHGYEVATAKDGEEALAKYLDFRPGLIILDILMPKMDGYTFVREIKTRKDAQEIPIIVLTAKQRMAELFKLEGIQDYIVKPYQINDLLEKVQKHLQS